MRHLSLTTHTYVSTATACMNIPAPSCAKLIATIGRLTNDPRVTPAQHVTGPLLQDAVALSAAPYPTKDARVVTSDHPSLIGRVANDPRGGASIAADSPEVETEDDSEEASSQAM